MRYLLPLILAFTFIGCDSFGGDSAPDRKIVVDGHGETEIFYRKPSGENVGYLHQSRVAFPETTRARIDPIVVVANDDSISSIKALENGEVVDERSDSGELSFE